MGISGGFNIQLVVVHKNQVPVLCKSTKYWLLPWKTRFTTPYIMEGKIKSRLKGGDARQKNFQLNSCQAKNKPPRPLRSERSRKADGTASSRIACQESTLWQCDTQHTVWCHAFLRLTSCSICALRATKRTKESNYITNRIFGLIKRDKISCQIKS